MHVSICLVGRRVVEGKEANMKSVCVCGGDVCMSTAQLRGQTFPHELFQYAMHNVYNMRCIFVIILFYYMWIYMQLLYSCGVCVFAGIVCITGLIGNIASSSLGIIFCQCLSAEIGCTLHCA